MYGISESDYADLLDIQDGGCAICGQPKGRLDHDAGVLPVDHDHETGEVRGLLCNACNTGLGSFQDSPALLLSAMHYLAHTPMDAIAGKTGFEARPLLRDLVRLPSKLRFKLISVRRDVTGPGFRQSWMNDRMLAQLPEEPMDPFEMDELLERRVGT